MVREIENSASGESCDSSESGETGDSGETGNSGETGDSGETGSYKSIQTLYSGRLINGWLAGQWIVNATRFQNMFCCMV